MHTHRTPQLDELLQHVVPGSSLAELTALEAILCALVAQGQLAPGPLGKALLVDICSHYQQLCELRAQQQEQARATQAQVQHEQGGAGGAGGGGSAMDVDGASGGSGDCGAAPAGPLPAAADGDSVSRTADGLQAKLRHSFTLLSLLAAAAPGVLAPEHVRVLLEIGLGPLLAVSGLEARRLHAVLTHDACLLRFANSAVCCMCSMLLALHAAARAALVTASCAANTQCAAYALLPLHHTP